MIAVMVTAAPFILVGVLGLLIGAGFGYITAERDHQRNR